MADKKTSLIVRMTDGADGVKAKSITNVNPDATLTELKTLAQGLVGLTDRSYVGSTRIEQTDTTYVEPEKEKPEPTYSFWLGDKQLNVVDHTIQFSIAEMIADTTNVVHENNHIKFYIEIRDVMTRISWGEISETSTMPYLDAVTAQFTDICGEELLGLNLLAERKPNNPDDYQFGLHVDVRDTIKPTSGHTNLNEIARITFPETDHTKYFHVWLELVP